MTVVVWNASKKVNQWLIRCLSFNLKLKRDQRDWLLYTVYRSIMSMLLDDNVKAISTGIISQLDLDLCQCETFAVSEPVPGLGKGSPPYSSLPVVGNKDLTLSFWLCTITAS